MSKQTSSPKVNLHNNTDRQQKQISAHYWYRKYHWARIGKLIDLFLQPRIQHNIICYPRMPVIRMGLATSSSNKREPESDTRNLAFHIANTLIKDGNIFKQKYLPFAGKKEKKNRNSFIDLHSAGSLCEGISSFKSSSLITITSPRKLKYHLNKGSLHRYMVLINLPVSNR